MRMLKVKVCPCLRRSPYSWVTHQTFRLYLSVGIAMFRGVKEAVLR